MIKKNNYFTCIFCRFTLLVCEKKNILANLTNSQEPEPEPVGAGCFWLLGAGAAREKNQEPEPLEKKSGAGAGAAKKLAGSPALDLTHTCTSLSKKRFSGMIILFLLIALIPMIFKLKVAKGKMYLYHILLILNIFFSFFKINFIQN